MNILKNTIMALAVGLAFGWALTSVAEQGEHSALICSDPAHLHCAASTGDASKLYTPEISAVVNAKLDVSDMDDDEDDENLRLDALELQVSGFLAPNIHGTAVVALEQEYEDGDSETETELEEAFIRVFDLPGGLEIRAGRTLVPFGVLNQSHSHEWVFADTPAAFEELFSDHSWFDDGVQVRWSNQAEQDELFVGLTLAAFNGREPGHGHEDGEEGHEDEEGGHEEDEGHDDEEEVVEWDGKVWLARLYGSLPIGEETRVVLGGTVTGDERSNTVIAGGDLTLITYLPDSAKRLVWQTEVFQADQDERDSSPLGLFSALSLDLTHRWQAGGRYDWTERLLDDSETIQGGAAFLTYRFTPFAFLRGQFKHVDSDHGESENLGTLQLVWGLGKHSHH
jgi:hypothetical protein